MNQKINESPPQAGHFPKQPWLEAFMLVALLMMNVLLVQLVLWSNQPGAKRSRSAEAADGSMDFFGMFFVGENERVLLSY